MGSTPGPRPLFCKKAGQKTFTWLDFRQPKPLAAAASDEISPRSGHLSGRVAPPTQVGEAGGSRNLTGAPPPQKRFSLGLHPVSLGKTKEMGWNRQHQRKVTQNKTASSANPKTHTKTPGKLSLAGGGHSVLLQQTFTIQPRVSGTLPHWIPVSSSYRRCVTGPILLSAMMWSLSL